MLTFTGTVPVQAGGFDQSLHSSFSIIRQQLGWFEVFADRFESQERLQRIVEKLAGWKPVPLISRMRLCELQVVRTGQ